MEITPSSRVIGEAVKRIAALVFVNLLAAGAAGAAGVVDVVLSQDTAVYRTWRDAFQQRLLGLDAAVQVRVQVSPPGESSARVIVGVGAGASEEVLRDYPARPIFITFLSRRAADADLARLAPVRAAPASALYLDQPPDRYFRLIRATLPSAARVAVLLGTTSREDRSPLREAGRRAGLSVEDAEFAKDDNIVKVLESLLERADVLLVPPDPEVSNEQNVYPLLLATYRRGIPVIAFSAAYVKAGALAAVYATPAHLGEQTADIVARFLRERERWPAPQYAEDFQVSVNRHVARSLGLSVPDEAELYRRLLSEEPARASQP